MNKSSNSLNRRDFLHLSSLMIGGMVASPLLRILKNQAGGLESNITNATIQNLLQLQPPLQPNPLLQALGFSDADRVVIIESQDLGLCEANLAAFYELVEFGLVTSGRALVPSAWFPQVAHFARVNPKLDIGVSLTLLSVSEAVRWRPLSTVDGSSGLVDEHGYFPLSPSSITATDTRVVASELEAQIQRAQGMGMRLTHLAVSQQQLLNPIYLDNYLQAAQEAQLPFALLRPDLAQWSALPGISAQWVSAGMEASTQLAQQGAPLLDSIIDLSSTAPDTRLSSTKLTLDNLGAGVHLITVHAAKDTPELRALTPDWNNYVADYLTWTNQELAMRMRNSGIQVVQWKDIQAIYPG